MANKARNRALSVSVEGNSRRGSNSSEPRLPQPWINHLSNGTLHAFVSQAVTCQLKIDGQDSTCRTTYIDNVSLVAAVPETSTLALLGGLPRWAWGSGAAVSNPHLPCGIKRLLLERMTLHLETGCIDLDRAFRVAVGDIFGNIVPSRVGLAGGAPELMAGLTYEAWTRDAAINTWNGLPALWPEAARATLLGEVTPDMYLRGQYWDAVAWTTGAWQLYLWTGDREFLALAREVSANWLARMEREELGAEGLFRGPACFQDGISGYGDRYAAAGGSSCILDWVRHHPDQRAPAGFGLPMQALSTNCLYYNAYRLMERMDVAVGRAPGPRWAESAARLRAAIRERLFDPASGRFRYYADPWGGDGRQEGMGIAFALMFGLVDDPAGLVARVETTPHGLPCLWPNYPRYEGTVDGGRRRFGRHSGLIWPQVQALWAYACALHGQHAAAFREMDLMTVKALRDGNFFECYHPDDGLPEGGVQEIDPGSPDDWHRWCLRERHGELPGGPLLRWVSQPRTTWGAAGYLRLVLHVCAGLELHPDRLEVRPHLPPGVDRLTLTGIRWREATLDLTVTRGGAPALALDGHPVRHILPDLPGRHTIQATFNP